MFGFQEAAGTYHVIPIAARSRTGLLYSYDALLETTVTIADGETDGLRALQMLVSTVSVRAKRKLLVGTSGEQARDILLSVLRGTGVKMSWQIFCSPGDEASDCYLNIHRVSP